MWDAINPNGMIDAQLSYSGDVTGLLDATAATRPAAIVAGAAKPTGHYTLLLKPKDLSIMPRAIPYQLDHCSGTVTVTPDGIVLTDISGTHGKASIAVSGKGVAGQQTAWDLSVNAQKIGVDADLVKALPSGFARIIEQTHLHGTMSLVLDSLKYRDADGSGDFTGHGRRRHAPPRMGRRWRPPCRWRIWPGG